MMCLTVNAQGCRAILLVVPDASDRLRSRDRCHPFERGHLSEELLAQLRRTAEQQHRTSGNIRNSGPPTDPPKPKQMHGWLRINAFGRPPIRSERRHIAGDAASEAVSFSASSGLPAYGNDAASLSRT